LSGFAVGTDKGEIVILETERATSSRKASRRRAGEMRRPSAVARARGVE
jgi:hypothetical protein